MSLGAFGFSRTCWLLQLEPDERSCHCVLFIGSCATCYLSPAFWWLVRSGSGLPEQCLFIRELLCLDSKGEGKAGLKHQDRLDIVLRLLVGQCFLGLIYCGHVIIYNLCEVHHSNQTGVIAWRLAGKTPNYFKTVVVVYASVKAYYSSGIKRKNFTSYDWFMVWTISLIFLPCNMEKILIIWFWGLVVTICKYSKDILSTISCIKWGSKIVEWHFLEGKRDNMTMRNTVIMKKPILCSKMQRSKVLTENVLMDINDVNYTTDLHDKTFAEFN